jgi:hypothetical protein
LLRDASFVCDDGAGWRVRRVVRVKMAGGGEPGWVGVVGPRANH